MNLDQSLGFCKAAHHKQVRKYTNEPYWKHPMRVSNKLYEYAGIDDFGVLAAAHLHDVLEDTEVSSDYLRSVFKDEITDLVIEVTDTARPEDGNRFERSLINLKRMVKTSWRAKSIKAADIADNAPSIIVHDPSFALVWVPEKLAFLRSVSGQVHSNLFRHSMGQLSSFATEHSNLVEKRVDAFINRL